MIVVLVLVLWAALELFVAIKVADAIGVLATVVLLLLSWPLGTWALRSQGRAAWRRLGAAVLGRKVSADARSWTARSCCSAACC